MSWIQILVLLNFRAFKKKGQTKNCSKRCFNHQLTCSNPFAKCNANYAELLEKSITKHVSIFQYF